MSQPTVTRTSSRFETFRRDAARWVVPEEIGDADALTWRVVARLLYLHAGLRAIAWFRVMVWMKRVGLRGGPSFVQRRLHRVYGLEMLSETGVGPGCYIAHTSGCTIRARSIGANVSIIGAITVGVGRVRGEIPDIGDEAFLGTGCRVLGGITIGAGAKVGANAVVTRDVAPGTTVVGVPARPVGGR